MTTEAKISKAQKRYKSLLQKDEQILAVSFGLIYLTNGRIIQLGSSFSSEIGIKVVASFPLKAIKGLSYEYKALDGKLTIDLKDGSSEVLKGLGPKEWAVFEPEFLAASKSPLSLTGVSEFNASSKKVIDAADKEEKAKQEKAAKAKEKADMLQNYGNVSAEGSFGLKYITIYSKGYVRVSNFFKRDSGGVEKLLEIFGESDITKKSGPGRAVGAILTSGANLLMSPNQRGNIYLTITTNVKTHSLIKDLPQKSELKAMNALVTAGKAAISAAKQASSQPQEGKKHQDSSAGAIDAQLGRLADLYKQGLIDESEFKASKKKLIDS